MSLERKNKHSLSKTIVSLILILGPTLYFGYMGKPVEMGVALTAGALSAAFLNLDRLEKFKGAGIEFELKKAVEEAYATMENVKSISEPLFIASIKMMTEGHTMDGIPEKDQHEIVKLISKLSFNNLTSEEVKKAVEGFYRFNLKYEYYRIVHHIDKYYPDATKKLIELLDDVSPDFPNERQVRKVLSNLPIQSNGLEEIMKDYAYYREHRYPRSHS